jgi:hypothetical protein
MSADELTENLRYFTEGMVGPRTTACTGLVLSGVGVATRSDIPGAMDMARSLGFERIVLHVGGEDLDTIDPSRFEGRVDTLVIPVQPESGQVAAVTRLIDRATATGLGIAANTVLTSKALAALEPTARALSKAGPGNLTFTYPFPINGNEATSAPSPPRVMSALRKVLPLFDESGIRVQLKGLPACHLGTEAHRLAKTHNRYYVDADHQTANALMFFPDVVRFHKADACRFCSMDGTCDGFFATYLRRPGFPALKPIDPLPTAD